MTFIGTASQRVAILVVVVCLAAACDSSIETDRESQVDPVARACELDRDILVRLWRGHDPVGSEDVTIVPREPNFIGSFNLVSHSGPWDYLQRIPLIFYGPDRISSGPIEGPANIVDVYPTVGTLLGIDLPQRDGRGLDGIPMIDDRPPPKLVLVVVWDGAGRATLERWPDAWPTLARLERDGNTYVDATVGTSPSVTSAVHASLATGAWPRRHGVTGNEIRQTDGTIDIPFADYSGNALGLTTLADEIDLAYANESVVGALGWTQWHVGMLGSGAAVDGGDDADELGLIEYRNGIEVLGNDDYFSTPTYLGDDPTIEGHIAELDRRDGTVDGEWLGHDISLDQETTWLSYGNPAWAAFQADLVKRMIDTGGYGRDEVPDLLLTNFKMTDLAGHRWALDSGETADVLAAQDAALGDIVEHLDSTVRDYVVVVTADHGHSRTPEASGAWPIDQQRLIEDLNAHFGVDEGSLVENSSAFGLYLEDAAMRATGTRPEDVATFLNGYTIADNWTDDPLPEGYQDRGDEPVFSAAYAKSQLDAVMQCAFSSSRPPRNARA